MQLHAQPYDTSAPGFYFEDQDDFDLKVTVEEYEIQFIDGTQEEAELAQVWHLTQSNFQEFIDFCEDAQDLDAPNAYYSIMNGYTLGTEGIVFTGTVREYSDNYVDDCLELEGVAATYFDYAAFARDMELGGDVSGFQFNNQDYVWDNHV